MDPNAFPRLLISWKIRNTGLRKTRLRIGLSTIYELVNRLTDCCASPAPHTSLWFVNLFAIFFAYAVFFFALAADEPVKRDGELVDAVCTCDRVPGYDIAPVCASWGTAHALRRGQFHRQKCWPFRRIR